MDFDEQLKKTMDNKIRCGEIIDAHMTNMMTAAQAADCSPGMFGIVLMEKGVHIAVMAAGSKPVEGMDLVKDTLQLVFDTAYEGSLEGSEKVRAEIKKRGGEDGKRAG